MRNFLCEETGEPCAHGNCKIGLCMEKRRLQAEAHALASREYHQDVAAADVFSKFLNRPVTVDEARYLLERIKSRNDAKRIP